MTSKFKSAYSYQLFTRKVMRYNRYVRDPETEQFLSTVLATSRGRKQAVLKNSIFWRTQLGYEWQPLYDGDHYIDDAQIPGPLSVERMKPLPDRTREGRANPKGIPYLYLSTRKETAIAEVRPWLGSRISLSQFKIQRDLTIINCSTRDQKRIIYLKEPAPKEREKAVWIDIDKAFSEPVTPNDELAEYVPTQIIAELFKKNGFDGIAYRSAFRGGHNIVLFDLNSADLINCTLFEITDVRLDFREASNPYFVGKYYKDELKRSEK